LVFSAQETQRDNQHQFKNNYNIMTLFDYAQSIQDRDKGMSSAVQGRAEILTKVRSIAGNLARIYGKVTADMVRAEYEYRGGNWSDLGNAAGSIFKGKQWQCVGFENSTVTTSHARALRVWSLK
jgi:hypothetical protein